VDRIKEMMDQLSQLDDAQVAELQSGIISEFESVEKEDPSPETVDAMTSLADMLDSVRTEIKQREAAVEELAQRAAEAASRVYGQDGDKEDDSDSSTEKTEEMPKDDSESEAAMDGDMKDEEEKPEAQAPVEEVKDAAPAESEAPVETEPDAEAPKAEDEEEKKKMSEASAEAEKTAELSTETKNVSEASAEETTTETAPAVKETVTASAEDAPEDEDEATEAEADASVEDDAVAEASVKEEATTEASSEEDEATEAEGSEEDAAAEVSEDAEAAIKEPTTETELSAQETMEAPVTAAANADNLSIEVPEDRRLEIKESAATVAITAGADIPGYTAGSPLEDMNAVAEAMAKRIHALRRVNGGDGEQHIVASVTTSFPEERTLTADAESNWAKIAKVASPEAITAAGGHVAPFEAKYDIFGIGTTARPVRDALPRFQADRGGIRFVTPPILSSYGDAVGVWTAANDAAAEPSPAAKTSLTVAAASENTVATDAVTLQMQFGNLATRAYPELIARHNELGLIQHAREAEQYLLSKIAAGSTAVSTTSLIGFGRDMLVQVARAATAYRSRHRLEADAPLRVILPAWVKDAMVADLALSMPGDNTLNAYGEIDGYLASRGVVASYSLDQNVYGAQSTGALIEFADSFTWYMFAEGTFLFLDGGTLDLGIIRDSSLVGTNDYKMFVETFEGVAKVGVEGLAITSTISVNGVAAALRDTTGGATAAAIEY
jgi:chemotaxis protein histidine kinase CheA